MVGDSAFQGSILSYSVSVPSAQCSGLTNFGVITEAAIEQISHHDRLQVQEDVAEEQHDLRILKRVQRVSLDLPASMGQVPHKACG